MEFLIGHFFNIFNYYWSEILMKPDFGMIGGLVPVEPGAPLDH